VAYRLKAGESVPEGLKRIVCEEIEWAANELEGQDPSKRDDAIHEARKSMKKIRAALRLAEPELGAAFRTENSRFREIGRNLSVYRDAGVMIETFDNLKRKYHSDLGRRTLGSIRKALVSHKEQTDGGDGIARVLGGIARTVRREARHVEKWRLQADGFPALAPGLAKTYRRGRKAMGSARKKGRAENYHEWRKRVKEHWYHVRLLESVWSDVMIAYEKSLKELETWLGEDHNLVVLRDKVAAEPLAFGSGRDVGLLMELIDKHQKELRDNAMSLGARIYQEKAGQFTRRLEHLWDAWKRQPDALKEMEKKDCAAKKAVQPATAKRGAATSAA
jgi:CHAD domain-containing protein